jgi:hypothetical protein
VPKSGYQRTVDDEQSDGVRQSFENSNHRSTIEADCSGGTVHAHVEEIVVDEPALVEPMRVVWERTKQLIEPSAAVAFAAARAAELDGARVGIICSGGNVDLDSLPW